jgi:hypothetical protein
VGGVPTAQAAIGHAARELCCALTAENPRFDSARFLKAARERAAVTSVYQYDESCYGVGDRVELHPATNLWMRGGRYGTVHGISCTPKDRVRVELDKFPGRTFAGSADTFRRAD